MKKKQTFSDVSGNEKVRLLAGWLDEKQAGEIMALDVSQVCAITEYIIVATARGARHAQALANSTLESAGVANLEYLSMEGYQNANWVLMDFNDVVIHIFQSEVRSLYNIEGLWSQGKSIKLELADKEN